MFIATAFRVLVLVGGMVGASVLLADDDEDEDHEHRERHSKASLVASSVPGAAPWKAECDSCHLAYPPGLLPERSWRKMMSELDRHFGESATVEPAVNAKITAFLVANAADRAGGGRPSKIARSISPKETPLRITETTYFRRKHDELDPAVFRREKVGGPANCGACHPGAEEGDFDDDRVKIPR